MFTATEAADLAEGVAPNDAAAQAKTSGVSLYIIVAIIVLVILLCACFYCMKCRKKKNQGIEEGEVPLPDKMTKKGIR